MIISQTPFRVSFFGGGSDLPPYYRQHGGAVLATAIDKSVYVTVSKKFDEAIRVSYSRTEEVEQVAQIQHPLVREALEMLGIRGGVEITSVADIPGKGTGLGSSSSFTVGLLNALHAYCGRYATAPKLSEEGCQIEIERCGEPIGKQDQYTAAFGGFNFIRFNADNSVDVKKVLCPPQVMQDLQSRLLFFYTGLTRSASDLLRQQSTLIAKSGVKAEATGKLVRLAEVAFENLCAGTIEPLGEMLDEAWHIKKQLVDGISNRVIDDVYQTAIRAGATGGKLLGAGGGGFLMFYASPERHDAIRHALQSLREMPIRFAGQGSRIIFVHDTDMSTQAATYQAAA
jgi:D-glycero-alpha-D-manno-heptose-7-phosphate kinase